MVDTSGLNFRQVDVTKCTFVSLGWMVLTKKGCSQFSVYGNECRPESIVFF